jgi:hypothetical protein
MNYIEKALERVNKLIEQSEENLDEQIDYIVMKQACEKQIAVSRNIVSGKYYCPKCDAKMKTSGFCQECGQKLY